MIQIDNISFNYAGSTEKVFSDFSLQLKENNIYGLLGKNGTGKSTLLYLISGLLHAGKGSITFDGIDTRKRRPEVLEEMFIVPEEFELPNITLNGCYLDKEPSQRPTGENVTYGAGKSIKSITPVEKLNPITGATLTYNFKVE